MLSGVDVGKHEQFVPRLLSHRFHPPRAHYPGITHVLTSMVVVINAVRVFPGTVGYTALVHLQKAPMQQGQSTYFGSPSIGSSALPLIIHLRSEHPLST